MRNFLLIWSGQLVSVIGSGLTGFALGYWVYQETHSVTRFTLIFVMTSLPGVVLAPFAGAFVDRWNRRRVMLLSDSVSALVTAVLTVLMATGSLRIWHIYLGVALQSTSGVFQWLAYSAAITMQIPKEQFARADGLRQLGTATAQVLSPFLAGVLVTLIHIWGVLVVDLASFVVALATLAFAHIPDPVTVDVRKSLWKQVADGWLFIAERPGLKGLLWLFAVMNLLVGLAFVLVTPLVLSFSSAASLGGALAAASSGLVVGSLMMSAWGGPRRRVLGILALTPVLGLGLVAAGIAPSLPAICAGMFLFLAGASVVNGCSQGIWQSKVPPDLQGRVFAVRRMLAQSTTPIAYLLAGPLADRYFEPLMSRGGALAATLGPLLGVGRGRGIGLLFLTMGLLLMVSTTWGFFYPPLRRLETEIPDAVGPGAPAAAGA